MAQIITAVICNLIAALILVGGILSSLKCGWKVSLTKFILTGCSYVATFFLAPYLANKLLGIEALEVSLGKVLETYHISQATVSSCLFLLIFLVLYLVVSIICSIEKHCLIKGMRKRATINRAKIRRAKSINPEAERAAKRTAWKEMKASYYSTNNFWKRLASLLMGIAVAVSVGIVVIIPFGYVAKDMNYNGSKEYLVKGYEKTLPGLIGDKFTDWVIRAEKEEAPADEQPSEEDPLPEIILPEDGE